MKRTLTALTATLLMIAGCALAQAPADTYVYQTFGEPVTLDPARGYDTGSGAIIENVYETLFLYDGEAVDEFVPALALDYTASDDGLTWRFNLREDVKFHSGNTMSCKDVEWSFKNGAVTAHPEGAPAYLMGGYWLGTQTDGGDKDAYLAEVTWEMIDRIVECPAGPDGLVAVVNLVNPTPALVPILTYTAFSVVDSEWAIENGMWDGTEETWQDWIGRDLTAEFMHDHMSGTGAYKLVEWTDNSLVAERFDDYWGGAPAIKNVVYQYVDEQSSRILAIQQGDADRVTLNERAALNQLRGSPGVKVLDSEGWYPTSVTAVFFNFDINTDANEDVGSGQLDGNGIPSDFFADANVRRAFAHLFDQEGFIEQIYEGSGAVLTMGMPRDFLGYNAEAPYRTLDLEAAEEYFRAAFGGEVWEKGFQVTALYNTGNTIRQTALEIIADNLEFINPKFRMNVRGLPWADYLARTAEQKAPMFALGWAADYADPSNFIDTFYDKDGYYAARTSINVPSIQTFIDRAGSIIDPVERGFLYSNIASEQFDQEPLLIVPVQEDFMIVRDNLEGYYYNSMLSTEFYWKNLSKN